MNRCQTRRFGRGASAALLGAWMVLSGCGKEALDSREDAICRSDADCRAEQRCKPISSPGERPQVVAPCMVTFSLCTTSADCSNGQVCWPQGRTSTPLPPNCYPNGRLCGPPCSTSSLCLTDETCEANGECRLPACDEASAMACPDHWRCNPVAAETETVQPVIGANEQDSQNYGRDVLRGCARIRCDESGGFTCKAGWACDPEKASDPSGCVALPCADIGHCSDDASFICVPTSSGGRPMGNDVHGCVLRNCEEGFACQRIIDGIDVGYCDFEGPLVDAFGCASLRCDEPGSTCSAGLVCEPSSSLADSRGCRLATCEEGASCGSLPCDPASPNADSRGCVASTSTGAGGTSGGSGSAGGTSGSSGSGAGTGASGRGAQGGVSSGGNTGASGGSGVGGSGGSSGMNAGAGTAPVEGVGRCVAR